MRGFESWLRTRGVYSSGLNCLFLNNLIFALCLEKDLSLFYQMAERVEALLTQAKERREAFATASGMHSVHLLTVESCKQIIDESLLQLDKNVRSVIYP